MIYRGTKLLTFGDSITQGIYATTPEYRYPNVVAKETGWTLQNLATGGEVTAQSHDNIFGTNIENFHNSVWMPGLNDLRFYGINDDALDTFKKLVQSGLVWLSIPEQDKIESDEPGWVYEGNWTQLRLYTNNLGSAYSSEPGSKASINVTGDRIYLGIINRWGFADCTPFEVFIDGVSYGMVNPCIATVPGHIGSIKWFIQVERFEVEFGEHLVEVVHTGQPGKLVHISFIAANGNINKQYPHTYLCSAIRLPQQSWTHDLNDNPFSWFNQGSDWAVQVWNNAAKEVAGLLASDGLFIKHINTESAYIPEIHVGWDEIHPSDAGYHAIGVKVIEGIRCYTNQWDKTNGFNICED